MHISDNALNVLAAKTYKGIGRAWIVRHLRGNETANKIVTFLNQDAKNDRPVTQEDFESVKEGIRSSLRGLAGVSDGVVAIGDEDFPSCRGDVKSSERPVALFYRGNLGLLARKSRNVAVIGLLNPDKVTELLESDFVSTLVGRGATIVSGLALGCDTAAHKQTLRSGGKTVAMLPSPLDDILPSANRGLAEEIVKSDGLLVTEYYEKAKSRMELSGRYQERDRLQALFSDCVVLAASYAKNDLGNDSGSRLAMGYASSYSIARAVMYDPATDAGNPKYDLNRQVLSEPGEIVVINRGNMDSAATRILGDRAHRRSGTLQQADLFGS